MAEQKPKNKVQKQSTVESFDPTKVPIAKLPAIVIRKTTASESIGSFVDGLIASYSKGGIAISNKKVNTEFLDSGNLALNYILTGSFDLGYPEGQVVEIHGESASGKSLLLYIAIKNFLEKYPDGVAILDDAEFSYVQYLNSELTLDESRLMTISSSTVEDHANLLWLGGKLSTDEEIQVPLVKALLSKTKHVMVVLDSLAVLSTNHELGVGLAKPDMSKAKLMKASMRVIMPLVKNNQVSFFISNHLIDKIATGPMASFTGPQKIVPAGGGVVYQASVRISVNPCKKLTIKDTHEVIGMVSRAKTVKNRFAPPFRSCEIEIRFDKGLSKFSGLVPLLKMLGVLKTLDGGWYEVPGCTKFQEKQIPEIWDSKLKPALVSGKIKVRELEAEALAPSELKLADLGIEEEQK